MKNLSEEIIFEQSLKEEKEPAMQTISEEDVLGRGTRKGSSFEVGIISVSQETKTANMARGAE